MKKVLILDAGPIINLSMNGLLEIFEKINQNEITIAITNYVYQEVVDRPMHIPRFELGALRIKELIERGVIKFATDLGLAQQEIESIIAIDERTTRVLFEKPENLKDLMSSKLHREITLDTSKLKNTSQFKFIRSSELVYMAYKNKFLKLRDKHALEALLYATKFKGCAISWEEIKQLKRL